MDSDYTVRLVQPQEAPRVVALLERCYRGTYTNPAALDPEQVARQISSGGTLIALAETRAGAAVGTGSLEAVHDVAATYGRCVVDHEHRGHGLLGRIGRLLVLDAAPRHGLRYVHSSVVTNHAYAQQHCVDLGAAASGLLLGHYPAGMHMHGIGRAEHPVSAAQVVVSHDRDPEARQLGLRGEDLSRARRVLDACRIPSRVSRGGARGWSWDAVHRPGLGLVHLVPRRSGAPGSPELTAGATARLLWADVPATDPGAQAVLDRLRERGFCFGAYLLGLGPEGEDVVRMQRYQGPELLSEGAVCSAPAYHGTVRDVFADYRRSLAVHA
ncbi:MAG: hypothetical protein KDD82_25185 [Planctomycetes bacterium]|nr:hypothetical protein [Planctomycetota bacterium]